MSEAWRPDYADTAPFAPFRPYAQALSGDNWPTLTQLDALAARRGLRNDAGQPLRFVAQTLRCGQRDYELSVLANAEVPTREHNWHDLFNALVWLAWPATKAALNTAQCAALKVGGRRSPASDAATLFDESGVVLIGEAPELLAAIRAHRWQEVGELRRGDWARLRACVIGHAVMEKLLTPWPGITAKCWHLDLPAESPSEVVDAALAEVWRGGRVATPRDLFPLPVLGIPGWWPGNADPGFYADTRYFRQSMRSM